MKAQMKSADRLQARYTAILGEDELARGEIALKSMETGERTVSGRSGSRIGLIVA